jgi:hypothetical protein
MATNHGRRLIRLEEVSQPKGRTVLIWDNHEPGCVEGKKARRTADGSLTEHDDLIILRWMD